MQKMRTSGPLVSTLLLTAAACTGPNVSGNTSVACRPLTVDSAQRPAGWTGSLFTIVMENRNRDQILGNEAAPYINSLADANAVAAGYHDSYVHPSEPNYLWMVAGENFGILNDDDPGASNTIATASHLADQLERAGLTWRAYEESMDQPCGLQSHAEYAVKHNPFAYFDDINGWNGSGFQPTARCQEHIVDYSLLATDLASGTPDYVFITPNLLDDMHDGTVAEGDAWLSSEVPKILASRAYQTGGALFLLWDEGSNSGDNPPFIVVSPNAKAGFRSSLPYDTSAYLLTVQSMLGLDALPCVSQPESIQPMSDLFTVPLPRAPSAPVSDGGV